jgi:signal transduction histidine kinase
VTVLISAALWTNSGVQQWTHARLLFWLDLAVGLACLVLSFYRRRYPLTVALLTNAAAVVSFSSAGPGVLAAVSLATRRVVWQLVLVGIAGVTASMLFLVVEPGIDDGPWWVTLTVGVAFTTATLAWGMYVGSRRELLWTLRDRAERAEAEQDWRVQQGRSNERARIAREMHDVLAHRISLITMHAGALAYRTDLTAEQMRDTAELIQAKSHEALSDLRQVLGVLRDGTGGPDERPQPTFGDLPSLVAEAKESGMRIFFHDHVQEAESMPEQVGRATYRIVQEGLTNARKHAPNVSVLVSVTGSRADGVEITIRNPARSLTPPSGADTNGTNGSAVPGSGLGLVGLRERAKLAGGHLATRLDGAMFELHGWLPWTPA